MRNKVWIYIGIAICIGILIFVQGKSKDNNKKNIIEFVEKNIEDLESVVSNYIEGQETDKNNFKNWEVMYWEEVKMVEFTLKRNKSSKNYVGFYYSAGDIPLGFQGEKVDYMDYENGWIWKEEGGDNWEYTEKIRERWYWFEMHF